ncbi:MAG: hypothetical protein Q7R41_10435 [Phycisphaerales bacterium]|nr:hypothetical protein [Phycisphaerales bacterium]
MAMSILRVRRLAISVLVVSWTALGLLGCRITIPLPPLPNDSGDGSPPGGGGVDGGSDQAPLVSLQASNTTPQLNEQVVLQCSIVAGENGSARFAFQPTSGTLIVNANSGRATFLVSETDLGVSIPFTCTAENDAGTSDPSNEVVITPSVAP